MQARTNPYEHFSKLYVKHFSNNECNKWLVREFKNFYNKDFILEKFIPRPDVSIIFHFKECPLISGETQIQLKPFFAAPIIPQSISLNLQGIMDTFIVVCKPTVFSRVFGIDLSPVQRKSIILPYDIFYPLWIDLSKIETISKRIKYFTHFINSFQKTPYIPDAIDIFYEKNYQ